MFDLENFLRFSVFSMCTHIKDCFYFYTPYSQMADTREKTGA